MVETKWETNNHKKLYYFAKETTISILLCFKIIEKEKFTMKFPKYLKFLILSFYNESLKSIISKEQYINDQSLSFDDFQIWFSSIEKENQKKIIEKPKKKKKKMGKKKLVDRNDHNETQFNNNVKYLDDIEMNTELIIEDF